MADGHMRGSLMFRPIFSHMLTTLHRVYGLVGLADMLADMLADVGGFLAEWPDSDCLGRWRCE